MGVFFILTASAVDKTSNMGARGKERCRGIAQPKPPYPDLGNNSVIEDKR